MEKFHLMIVPADAVRQRKRVLFIGTWHKGLVGGIEDDRKQRLVKRRRKEVTVELEYGKG